MKKHFQIVASLLLSLVFCLLSTVAFSQANAHKNASASASSQKSDVMLWPKKPIHLVVSFTPGGAPDTLARILAESWQKTLGVNVLVENRPGFGGNIGADYVAKSDADGYTLLIGTVGIHAINGVLYEKLSYDPVRDFAPISFLASTPNVLVVNKKLGVSNLSELITLAKTEPNQLTFGSSGSGTSLHMSGELIKEMTGIQIRHIPYKGRAQFLPDLVSGRISMAFDNLVSALPLIQAGEIRAIGITSLRRSAAAPDIPTIAEQGLPGFEAVSWFSLVGPAGLPIAIQTRLSRLTKEVLMQPVVQSKLRASGLEPAPNSPTELARFIDQEREKWTGIVKKSGAKAD
ncbi:tripartite tricarboxylate transporter substrate binding protein [Polynucleobacter sp. IMCC 30228]|uniref:Bug family tripartite tricarboxylate transporter substrate binding protein n=1 Tax=Polynucleobacter sp. IMCC 30228 TaxID=2781011 RepID=UPI001F1ACFB4|nr:tripartite tricarboxylate transporter substrate binding protein [Polynucleobacter sp. IMCC 30228]